MACTLGMLCEPLKSLGLHNHRSAAKKATVKRSVKKTVAKKTATRKKRK